MTKSILYCSFFLLIAPSTLHSGELDEGELICVLKDVGFEAEEARAIYKQVDSDGEGGVSLEEFEEWFMKNQRQQNMRLKMPVAMTFKSLEVREACAVPISLLCISPMPPLFAGEHREAHHCTA